MIRVVVIDDHPAVRAGLRTILEAEPGLVFAGECDGTATALWPTLRRAEPDLLLLDCLLPEGDGLQLCYRIKQRSPAPAVVVLTAYANPAVALAARLVGAEGLISKAVGPPELLESIRKVNKGERLLPPITHRALEEAYKKLGPDDGPLLGMLLHGTTETEAGITIGCEPRDIRLSVMRMLSALKLDVPATQLASDLYGRPSGA